MVSGVRSQVVRAGEVLHADDTPLPVLDPGRGEHAAV